MAAANASPPSRSSPTPPCPHRAALHRHHHHHHRWYLHQRLSPARVERLQRRRRSPLQNSAKSCGGSYSLHAVRSQRTAVRAVGVAALRGLGCLHPALDPRHRCRSPPTPARATAGGRRRASPWLAPSTPPTVPHERADLGIPTPPPLPLPPAQYDAAGDGADEEKPSLAPKASKPLLQGRGTSSQRVKLHSANEKFTSELLIAQRKIKRRKQN